MKQINIFALSKPKSFLKLAVLVFLVLFAGKFVIKEVECAEKIWN